MRAAVTPGSFGTRCSQWCWVLPRMIEKGILPADTTLTPLNPILLIKLSRTAFASVVTLGEHRKALVPHASQVGVGNDASPPRVGWLMRVFGGDGTAAVGRETVGLESAAANAQPSSTGVAAQRQR